MWAAGVTYLRSRDAREAESTVRDVYSKVYEAERPELFFKAPGWRVAGHAMPIRIRRDSRWNVPEPELTLVDQRATARSSGSAPATTSPRGTSRERTRSICRRPRSTTESCALGPGISLCERRQRCATSSIDLVGHARTATPIFTGDTRTSQLKRPLQELVDYLRKELDFPRGVFLMTGTGIVPPDDFSLAGGDRVRITIGESDARKRSRP